MIGVLAVWTYIAAGALALAVDGRHRYGSLRAWLTRQEED